MKTRRDFLKIIGLSAPALGLLSCTTSKETAGKKPNVVFILTDDQGYGDLHCHGNPFIKTPQMDKLASESASFSNFHVMTCCAPSRAMLMTGRYPMRGGVWCTVGNTARLKQDEVTMADVFKANGYRTGFFGKWHLGDNYPFRPQDRGFEEVLMSGAGGVGNTPDYWANDYFDDTYMRNGKWEKQEGFCTDVWFTQALRYIEANKDRPFFCYISTNAPHLPFVAPEKYLDMYRDEQNESLRAFYAMITNLDDNIGQLRQKLVELNIERDTILVFITDNGSVIGWRRYNASMRGNKGVQWDGGHRVPFFIRWPNAGLKGGQTIDQITSGIDVLPTLMDLCGLERHEGPPLDGISLVPLLKDNMEGWPNRTLFVQQQWGNSHPLKWDRTAVMTDEWRFVNNEILNKIKKDPEQQHNIIKDHPQVAARLRAEYDRWWVEIGKADPDQGKEIIIGSDKENPCKLTGHDNDHLWNHDQVLEGIASEGHWDVIVAGDGEYEFELRRYPIEANTPIRGTIPVPGDLNDFPYNQKNQYAMTHNRSHDLPVVSATCKIGSFQRQINLPRKAKQSEDYTLNDNGEVLAVKFRTKLKAGKTKLEAWFADKNNKHVTNAYYIYVKRLSI
jgi:arylsulfatase A-like enzyme